MNRKKGKKISFEQINLYKNNTPLKGGLRLLCCKDPSYVPLPPHHDWIHLQNLQNLLVLTDLGIRYAVVCSFLTRNKMKSVKTKKKSNCSVSKANSRKLETFLAFVERDLFCKTVPNNANITFVGKRKLI